MSAVITVSQGQVDAFIKTHLHRPANQCLDRFHIIIDRILHILYLTAVSQFPETIFQILLLNRCYILRHMTVKAVRNILLIGHTLDNTIFCTELFYLQTAQILCRRTVDRIEVSVLFLVFRDLIINMLQYLQRKSAVFYKRFTVI